MAKKRPKKAGHGGARPGSGRPPRYPGGTIQACLRLTPDTVSWLDQRAAEAGDSRSGVAEQILAAARNHAPRA